MTHETLYVIILLKLLVPRTYGLGMMVIEDFEDNSVNQFSDDEAVRRKAPATPSLSILLSTGNIY